MCERRRAHLFYLSLLVAVGLMPRETLGAEADALYLMYGSSGVRA